MLTKRRKVDRATPFLKIKKMGLDYLTLGQSATTGLHYDDDRKLMDVLQHLVSKGNTVTVIKHNLDVIKSADWIIDFGLEGGQVVAVGTPEEVSKKA